MSSQPNGKKLDAESRARITETVVCYTAARFSLGTPRSPEYQQGFLLALVRAGMEWPDVPYGNPHPRPSAAADAWDGGYADGLARSEHFTRMLARVSFQNGLTQGGQ